MLHFGSYRHSCETCRRACRLVHFFFREYRHGDLSKQQSLGLERVQASVARRILKAPWTTPKNVLSSNSNGRPSLGDGPLQRLVCYINCCKTRQTLLRIAFSPFLQLYLPTTSVSLDNLSSQLLAPLGRGILIHSFITLPCCGTLYLHQFSQ